MPNPDQATPGFAVLYRWKLKVGHEQAFQNAWAKLTTLIIAQRGGLGSRLHQLPDGSWAAYAQWPSEKAWNTAFDGEPLHPALSEQMNNAIEERLPTMKLGIIADMLI